MGGGGGEEGSHFNVLLPLTNTTALFQMSAFRTLRFLFSMERNRRMFKQLFPAELFEMFIDVGHYNKDLKAYKQVVDKLNSLPVRICCR